MDNNKKCFKCGISQPLESFYRHRAMRGGRLNKCKTCTKKDSINTHNEKSKDPEWVEKQRHRGREKYHRLNYRPSLQPGFVKKEYMTPEQIKESARLKSRISRERYPEKKKAHSKSQRIKPPEGMHKHHWSYQEEHGKDIIFFSVFDHNLIHRHMIYDQERMMYRNLDGILLDTKESHEELLAKIKENDNDEQATISSD